MAKRYHSGKSMEKHEYYAGEESRRKQEHEDGGMISEDHSAIANLPQSVMMKPYPKPDGYMPEDLDDTIRGKPLAMQKSKKSPKRAKVEERLVFEETTRVR